MSKLSELTRDELFDVLLCGGKLRDGFTLNDYMEEWNLRVRQEGGFVVDVPPVNE